VYANTITGSADAFFNTVRVGLGTGTNNSTNTVVGVNALDSNIAGSQNTAIGFNVLTSNTSGVNNTAVGNNALLGNTSGNDNTAVGAITLTANTNGYSNTAIGVNALAANTTGYSNTAVGTNSLIVNTTSTFNTAVGTASLFSNTSGSFNTALGRASLFINTTASNSTAVGYNSLLYITAGNNTAIGVSSGNMGITAAAGNSCTDCTFVGATSSANGSYTNSTAIGANSIITASNQIMLGSTAVTTVRANGNFTATGTITPLSDYRIKTNVIPLSSSYNVNKLNPVSYYNKLALKQDIGFIAHEVQEVFPELVIGEKDGPENQALNYMGIIPILVKEIQELKGREEILMTTIESFRKRLEILENV
jgi:hypothetical protein